MQNNRDTGFSGAVARTFQDTEITPLLALLGLLLGLFAVLVTPREEEPQINVTFANVFIPFPGAAPREVESLVATPAEQVLSEIQGVEHVYSSSTPGLAVLTVQFEVGENRTDAIVRLYDQVFSNMDWLPQGLGVMQPVIKPMGIDDVPIVAITLWSPDRDRGAYELGQIAHAIETQLKRVPGTRDIYTIGASRQVVNVELDPQALPGHSIAIDDIRRTLRSANQIRDNLPVTRDNREILIQAGTFLGDPSELGNLVVGLNHDSPVYLRDVAAIREGPDTPESYVWTGTGPGTAADGEGPPADSPAVTIAVAKQPGRNAADIARGVFQRIEQLRGTHIPDGVNILVTRDYGATANDKAMQLITKLVFATASVILLVWLVLGWREAVIVGAAVVITLAATLFASWAWGFTLNRVSLFALIFSIGILVDDAIVVVENIHRHLAMGAKNLLKAIPAAVDEVGGPTILATFTVIAALLPMAFVSGLMGPYMSPIPINASMGMLISLVVAFVFTPWLSKRMLGRVRHGPAQDAGDLETSPQLHALFSRIMGPFLAVRSGRRNRWLLLAGILLLIALSLSLAGARLVVLKMLPFDNKSEFQVVLDMPEGTSLEQTARVLGEMGRYLGTVPEVRDYQVYAGTSGPVSFNGLVRQYYLRGGAHLGDIQVNLVEKAVRDRDSHEIAGAVRGSIHEIARRHRGSARIVEVPPGPPVHAPLVAEIYGLDYPAQIDTAKTVRGIFNATPGIVDVDSSVEHPGDKRVLVVDRARAARFGVTQAQVATALATVLGGEDVAYMHGEHYKYAVPVRLEYAEADKADLNQLLSLRVRSDAGALVPLSEMVRVEDSGRAYSIHHKDLLPVVYVTGDMAGDTDSPLYGMFGIFSRLQRETGISQWLFSQPPDPYEPAVKWDGEWQVTYETFRDMGLAYSVGLLLIYLLVVAQFRSYITPLVIMAPIPLTVIGVMPGHALLGAQFTATSMIGMIALAGIIVRNSILLVDFINQEVASGAPFEDAVVRSASVRAKPIVLTGLAAMAGAFFILDDPIFSGLAVALISGILVSTMLTLVIIPVAYYAVMGKRSARGIPAG
ncbi:MAG: efflux RND transporter permease subunit [Gammaproteobacteria bacterium]|nr:efflux RND transporter permease subunit [Gammaproteobacteria bacterium]MYG68127.1 efflux RND transporter permease subunit [Gammaproteobacteria bacterium]